MNVYQIAPKLVRIKLDLQLKEQSATLNENLKWRPLSTNLDSCEKPPHLYFRITINPAATGGDYAGFPTGAPFILEREVKQDENSFFLRHWVRKSDIASHEALPLEPHPHMQIGAVDNRLILRVDIDREVDKRNVFKSIPFATNMFQVVQIDAIIHEMPHVRLAFAIERTLSPEERTQLGDFTPTTVVPFRKSSTNSTQNDGTLHLQYPSVTQGFPSGVVPTTMAPSTGGTKARDTVPTSSHGAAELRPAMGNQNFAQHGPPKLAFGASAQIRKRQPVIPPHAVASLYARGQFLSGKSRQVPMQMRQPVPKRPMSIAPHSMRPSARGNVKPKMSAVNIIGSAVTVSRKDSGLNVHTAQHGKDANGVLGSNSSLVLPGKSGHLGMMNENAKANTHPDVRIWEGHDANDPHEPLFITEDAKFMEMANKSIMLDGEFGASMRSEHVDLFGATTGDLDKMYDINPNAYRNADEADIEVPIDQRRLEAKEGTMQDVQTSKRSAYANAMAAAVEYNRRLSREREDLRGWLAQDAEFEEQQNIDEDAEDADSGSE